MMTNAQAALIAAASFMSNTPVGYQPASPTEVTALAYQWAMWLDDLAPQPVAGVADER